MFYYKMKVIWNRISLKKRWTFILLWYALVTTYLDLELSFSVGKTVGDPFVSVKSPCRPEASFEIWVSHFSQSFEWQTTNPVNIIIQIWTRFFFKEKLDLRLARLNAASHSINASAFPYVLFERTEFCKTGLESFFVEAWGSLNYWNFYFYLV